MDGKIKVYHTHVELDKPIKIDSIITKLQKMKADDVEYVKFTYKKETEYLFMISTVK